MEHTQLTVFLLIAIVGAVGGAAFAAIVLFEWFGLVGAAAGLLGGACLGAIPGLFLQRFVDRWLITSIAKSDSATLRRIVNEPVWNFRQNFALLQLAARGENVQDVVPRLIGYLQSNEPLQRRYAWDGIRLVFDDLASVLDGFDPASSTEACRARVDGLPDKLVGCDPGERNRSV